MSTFSWPSGSGGGGGGGVTSIGAFDSVAPNSDGGSIVGSVLTFQSATALYPGMVNISTQTFAGNKTFTGTIGASNLSGTNTGDVTLTAVGASPNADGASLSGQALTLQPANASFPGVLLAADWVTFNGKQSTVSVGALDGQAANANGLAFTGSVLYQQSADATHPGLVNNTTQTFSGNKTFTGTIGASNLSGTNTGDVTLTAVGAAPNANAASLSGQALTLQPASGSFPGVVTTGAQTFAGAKSFNGAVDVPSLQILGATSGAITQHATAVTTSYSIFWPAAQGGAGTVPTNDGSGNLSWAAPSVPLYVPGTTAGSVSTGGLPGFTDGSDAAAGFVGEYVFSYNNSGASWPSSGVWDDVTSIVLTAGDWDVSGVVTFQNTATATGSNVNGGIGTAAGATTTGLVTGDTIASINQLPNSSSDITVTIPAVRISSAIGITIYLKHNITYSATTGASDTVGRISARRVR